jgi:type II secretory pathway pseudopilin PulG
MVDPRHEPAARLPQRPSSGRAREGGFTLAEMLAALGILLFGITALLGALSAAAAQRRTADAQQEAAALCELAVHRIRHEAVRRRADAANDFDLELATLDDQTAPGFPGMTWSATAVVDDDHPEVWLVRIQVRWLELGDTVVQEFLRVLPRELPLGRRVRRDGDEPPASR